MTDPLENNDLEYIKEAGLKRRERLFAELSKPLHQGIPALCSREASDNEVEVTSSWKILLPKNTSEQVIAAGSDLKEFFNSRCGLDVTESDDESDSQGVIKLRQKETGDRTPEAYSVMVAEGSITIEGDDDSGIMYGVFYIQEQMTLNNAPVLKKGTVSRKPLLKTRILRSPMAFYSGEELLDIDNAYPETYLNKMAHHGINGIWLHETLKNIVKTDVFPCFGKESETLLQELNRLIKRCAKYGIKVYIYFTEPLALHEDHDSFKEYPHLKGHYFNGTYALCTSNEEVKQYLVQGMRNLFSQAEYLGGVILISTGEHHSHCYSKVFTNHLESKSIPECEKCAKRSSIDVLSETISLMNEGIKSVAPAAEVIAWNWAWDFHEKDPQQRLIEAIPADVVIMGDFEKGGEKYTDGYVSAVNEYCLSWVGPSKRFSEACKYAISKGHEVYAKLQISTTHEIATIPNLPLLYNVAEKIKKLVNLGGTGAMLCWNLGNMLSYNTEISNLFSWEPQPDNVDEVLQMIAARDFGEKAAQSVVDAWRCFNKSMDHFPFDAQFVTNGIHNHGPAYPFSFKQLDKPLAHNWLLPNEIDYSEAGFTGKIQGLEYGDQLDMLFKQFTPDQIIKQLEATLSVWNEGTLSMENISKDVPVDLRHNFIREHSIASAFHVQYSSVLNFLEFVILRNKLYEKPTSNNWAVNIINKQKNILKDLKEIVVREIKNAERGKEIAEKEISLGFHGEAFGFMYTPEKIESKIRKMKDMLEKEIPEYERDV